MVFMILNPVLLQYVVNWWCENYWIAPRWCKKTGQIMSAAKRKIAIHQKNASITD